MDILGKDLRHGFRALRNKPAFSLMAILTLALGIGASTAIFSIVDAVILRGTRATSYLFVPELRC